MSTTILQRSLPAADIPGRLARLLRGQADDPVWARPALLGLLGVTALLYLWALSASGWANDFYSAAAQAASQSWKAFFFGSSDAANFITVDKPPPPCGSWACRPGCSGSAPGASSSPRR